MLYYGSEDPPFMLKNPKLTHPNPTPQYFSGLVDEWWSKKTNNKSNLYDSYLCRTNSISGTVEGSGAEPSPALDFESRESPTKDPPPAQPTTGNNPTLQYGRG